MDTLKLLLNYFFNPLPLPVGHFKFLIPLIIITAALLAASIILRILLKKKKENKILRKTFKNLPGKLQTIAILEVIYLSARYLAIPFLSMRILNYIIIASTIYILARNIQIYLKEYPQAQKKHREQTQLNKYLPRKKH